MRDFFTRQYDFYFNPVLLQCPSQQQDKIILCSHVLLNVYKSIKRDTLHYLTTQDTPIDVSLGLPVPDRRMADLQWQRRQIAHYFEASIPQLNP